MIIRHLWDFNKVITDPCNKYAWPGGYPMYFVCSDGEALSWKAVEENAGLVRDAIIANDRHSGWHVCAIEINWEDGDLYCAHTSLRIESAYAEPEANVHREHCDRCNEVLEEAQIGKCDSCQEVE